MRGGKKDSDSRCDNGTASIIYPDTNRFFGQTKSMMLLFLTKALKQIEKK